MIIKNIYVPHLAFQIAWSSVAVISTSSYAQINASTQGNNSPIVANTVGNVTINYGITLKEYEEKLAQREEELKREFESKYKIDQGRLKALEQELEFLRRKQVLISPVASKNPNSQVIDVITDIAKNNKISARDQETVASILREIRSVEPNQIRSAIFDQKVTRQIREIVLHNSGISMLSFYNAKGNPSGGFDAGKYVRSAAQYQIENLSFKRPSYHFAVSPDGLIWLVQPLEQIATHISAKRTDGSKVNDDTIAVEMMLDGNKELPTALQINALRQLFAALAEKFEINIERNFAPKSGFHRDYYQFTSCPGELITKDMVLGWLK